MAKENARTLPRPFALQWGGGCIVEEVVYDGQHHEPSQQLLEIEDGSLSMRFCYYDQVSRYQSSPLFVGNDEVAGLGNALAGVPRLRSLLGEMMS